MSIVPNIQDEHDDLCFECGRDNAECVCRDLLPENFDPLDEYGYDPDWDDSENDLTSQQRWMQRQYDKGGSHE